MKNPMLFTGLLVLNGALALATNASPAIAGDDGGGFDDCNSCYQGIYQGNFAHRMYDFPYSSHQGDVNAMNWTHGTYTQGCWDHNHTMCCFDD